MPSRYSERKRRISNKILEAEKKFSASLCFKIRIKSVDNFVIIFYICRLIKVHNCALIKL